VFLDANRAQLDLFREYLPRKPYHTDEFSTGLHIADIARAMGARYIQPNGPTHRHWIVFDVDTPEATMIWDVVGAPARAPDLRFRDPCTHCT